MSAEQIAEIAQVLKQMGMVTVPEKEHFPMGVTGRDHRGVYTAESVNELFTWDDHVQAKDGGTYEGSKVYFVAVKKLNKSDKVRSKRDLWIATFNVSRPEGRNVINELVNIFIKNELDYRPYLTPEKWSYDPITIDFISGDDKEKPKKVRVKIHSFDGVPVSDSVESKCRYLLSLPEYKGTMYEAFVNGNKIETD